jgi:phosphoglycolate phosphatase
MQRIQFPRPQAVVFDLDGTLVDTAPDLGGALNRLLAEHDRPAIALDDIRQMIGDGAAKLVERGFSASGGFPADPGLLVSRFLVLYEQSVADLSRPFDGVAATLDRLRAAGLRLGVCTNKPAIPTQQVLAALDLDGYFETVAAGDGPARKPDPRHLMGVVDRLGATAATTIMIGDSANDVAAARAAGSKVIVVTFGYTPIPARELGADAVIESFEELPALLGLD